MKSKHPKNNKKQATKTHTSNRSLSVGKIDRVAVAIDEATRNRLPDGVMGGALRNHEEEIRQEAVLIQLRWYLKQHQGPAAGGARKRRNRHRTWNYSKAAAYALRYAKLRFIDRLVSESGNNEPLTEANGGVCRHDADLPLWKLPKAIRHAMALCGVRHAAERGLISAGNAEVAGLVLEEGMSVARVAARRGVTRGAIYQQLRRVVEVLPTVMEEIEVPHFEIG
jgi:hypothetical protein